MNFFEKVDSWICIFLLSIMNYSLIIFNSMYFNLKLAQDEKLEIPHSHGNFAMISFNIILYSIRDIGTYECMVIRQCSRLMPINVSHYWLLFLINYFNMYSKYQQPTYTLWFVGTKRETSRWFDWYSYCCYNDLL